MSERPLTLHLSIRNPGIMHGPAMDMVKELSDLFKAYSGLQIEASADCGAPHGMGRCSAEGL